MTLEAITTFIFFQDGSADKGTFQNSNTASPISFSSKNYEFLPFVYNGATKSLSGDNLESNLTFASNVLTREIIHEAATQFWSVQVDTVLMHPDTFLPNRTLTTEYWIASSFNYNVDGVQLVLSTAIDAVTSSIPNKVLRSQDVGALPVTSRISNA
jgi:hypothetical protein|tara:strand:- start:1383 stop:1850 length:468 start_codon:yes stop_codon:yes gene_type:complete